MPDARFIYLDYQATTPLDLRVLDSMRPYLSECFGNPASFHARGVEAAMAVEQARKSVARELGVKAREVYFTSGASEGNNLALKGVARRFGKGHIITCQTEHKCVLNACLRLEHEGFDVTYLGVDSRGLIDLNQLADAIGPDTFMVSIMYGNNETGVLQDLAAIGRLTRERGLILHCDATQAMGQVSLRPAELGVDLLTFSAHKLYGPKGVGAIYIGQRLLDEHLIACEIDGGGQEFGLRGGTLNVPGIVGLRKALEIARLEQAQSTERLASLRKVLLEGLADCDFICNTPLDTSLAHCMNLSFPGVNGQGLLQNLGSLAISTGSACNTGSQKPSHVLTAMGVATHLISSSVRLSVGRPTSEADVQVAAGRMAEAIKRARRPIPA
ncbi:cysteine desulfurase family protein [Pseudomonas sp. SBB6]|uniref:cysteine desulfurase family protein n=1 Tax=Pseudomonas sp. SBB6 TaxID=2962032 RepID=UPI0020B8A423|nr:cysteine desulfurase family protein [Pseudomonas sp. SBB6]MCP3751650.1 cysteine desulfurase [Pseudomonas sp. SBB6]